MHRPWDEHVREGRAISIILGVAPWPLALVLALPVEGVRLTVHRPAHLVGRSWPRSRARRIFPNGESIGARAGVPAQVPAHVCTPVARCLGAQHCLLHGCLRPAIFALSGATETSWEVLAQISLQSLMDCACVCAVYGLRRACARTAVRPVSVSMFAATCHG